MSVSCSAGFLLLLSALIYLDGPWLVLWILFGVLLHEAGHLIAASAVGCKVHSLRLSAVGAEMKIDSSVSISYWQDLLIAVSGPCINLAVGWAAIRCNAYMFAGINLSFVIMNLLPVWPLDGARMLLSVLNYLGVQRTDQWIYVISLLISGALLGFGWAAWRGCGNMSVLCTSAWLAVISIKGEK